VARNEGYRVVIVVLPLDTILRILDHANTARGAASKAGPALAKSIISALNKAKKAKANTIGPLEPSQFNDLSGWCRYVGLVEEGETVEAAVRASG
jgi:hypothetical protein